MAYQVARTAEGYFTGEELAGVRGRGIPLLHRQEEKEEIDRIAESESYLRIKEQLTSFALPCRQTISSYLSLTSTF